MKESLAHKKSDQQSQKMVYSSFPLSLSQKEIDHSTVVDLLPQPSSECEAEVDLALIQTFFALLWKLFLETTSQHKNNLIYIIKHEGLYQNKVTVNLASIHNCKMAYCREPTKQHYKGKTILFFLFYYFATHNELQAE